MIVTCPECATRYDVADKAFSSGGRAVRCNHCGCEWYQIGPSGARAGEQERDAFRDRGADTRASSGRGAARGRFDAREEERRLPLERGDRLQGDWSEEIYPEDEWDDRRSLPPPGGREASPSARAQEVSRRARGGRRAAATPATRQARRPAPRRSFMSALLFPLSGVALAGLVAAALFLGPSFNGGSGGANVPLTPTEGIETASSAAVSAPAAPQRTVANGLVFVESKYDLVERAEGPALEVWGRVANNSKKEALSPTIEIISKDKEGKTLQRWLAQPKVESIAPGESARFSSRMMYPLEPVHDVEFFIAAR